MLEMNAKDHQTKSEGREVSEEQNYDCVKLVNVPSSNKSVIKSVMLHLKYDSEAAKQTAYMLPC